VLSHCSAATRPLQHWVQPWVVRAAVLVKRGSSGVALGMPPPARPFSRPAVVCSYVHTAIVHSRPCRVPH